MPNDISSLVEQERFEELLPFYTNETLNAEDLAFVQAYIASHPEARISIQFSKKIQRLIRETASDSRQDIALNRLVASLQSHKTSGLWQSLLEKLRSWGISPPLAIAFLVIAMQSAGYAIHKMNWFNTQTEASSTATSSISITIKDGADLGAIGVIVAKFDGQIIHSPTADAIGKAIVSIADKARISELIDSLMDAGLIESAMILM